MQFGLKNSGGRELITITMIQQQDAEGWLTAAVLFGDAGFTARFSMEMMVNDLYIFGDKLQLLNKTLKGSAEFQNIEENVCITMTADAFGHIEVDGKLRHPSEPDMILSFKFESDQTFLPPLIRQIDDCLKIYQSFFSKR